MHVKEPIVFVVDDEAVQHRYASLTPRERDVMMLVVSGLSNKQVGWELGITESTVKAHRGQLMRKMSADSLPALVTMAAHLDGSAVQSSTTIFPVAVRSSIAAYAASIVSKEKRLGSR